MCTGMKINQALAITCWWGRRERGACCKRWAERVQRKKVVVSQSARRKEWQRFKSNFVIFQSKKLHNLLQSKNIHKHIQNTQFQKHRYCKHDESGGSHTYSYDVGTLLFASSSPAVREKQTENLDPQTCTEWWQQIHFTATKKWNKNPTQEVFTG